MFLLEFIPVWKWECHSVGVAILSEWWDRRLRGWVAAAVVEGCKPLRGGFQISDRSGRLFVLTDLPQNYLSIASDLKFEFENLNLTLAPLHHILKTPPCTMESVCVFNVSAT